MESQARTPAVTRVALAGLAAGAVGSSLLGPRILAGYAAVGLAVAVALALYAIGGGTRALPALGAVLVMAYPLAAVEQGEGGILWAAALTFIAMAGAYVRRGLGRDVVGSLAVGVAVVLHLGLLGSYLVLVAVSGNRLLGALVLMVVAFEAAHAVLVSRIVPPERPSSRGAPLSSFFDPKAALAGLAACVAASVLARLFLVSPPGLLSSVVLGVSVGAAATLGHAAAAATSEDFESGPLRVGGLDAGVFISLNALLFAAGAFYYGFRLYLA
jgi:hypothetical protein